MAGFRPIGAQIPTEPSRRPSSTPPCLGEGDEEELVKMLRGVSLTLFEPRSPVDGRVTTAFLDEAKDYEDDITVAVGPVELPPFLRPVPPAVGDESDEENARPPPAGTAPLRSPSPMAMLPPPLSALEDGAAAAAAATPSGEDLISPILGTAHARVMRKKHPPKAPKLTPNGVVKRTMAAWRKAKKERSIWEKRGYSDGKAPDPI